MPSMANSSPSEEQVLRDTPRNSGSSNAEEDGDFAIAKALQEQERAFLTLQSMLRRNARENTQASEEGREADSDEDADEGDKDEEDDDSGDGITDEDDEAYARRLQDEADREHYARLIDGSSALALQGVGIAEEPASDEDYDPNDPYGENDYLTDDSIDPDEMTYEELQALGEAVGSVSRGVPQAIIDALPHVKYCSRFPPGSTRSQEEEEEQCAVCRMEFEPEEEVVMLPCKHLYHGECIAQWLQDRKACPICGRELLGDGMQPGRVRDTVMEQPASK